MGRQNLSARNQYRKYPRQILDTRRSFDHCWYHGSIVKNPSSSPSILLDMEKMKTADTENSDYARKIQKQCRPLILGEQVLKTLQFCEITKSQALRNQEFPDIFVKARNLRKETER